MPQPPQQEPPPIATTLGKKGKARKRASKDKGTATNPAPSWPPKRTIQCDLCDVVSHASHTSPELPQLKSMVNETFPESDIPEVYVTIPDSIPKLKPLCTNHPCALCDFHGHYTHFFPCLEEYCSSLEALRQFEVECNESTTPLFSHLAPIHIPPYDVQIIGPWLEVPPDVSSNLPSAPSLVSTSIDPLSASSFVTPSYDVHANLSSHDEE